MPKVQRLISVGASLTYLLTSLPVSFLTQAPEKEGRVFFRRSMVIVFSSNEQATARSSANKTSFTFGQRFLNTPTLCHYCLSRQSRCKRYARCFFAWYVCELRQWCICALVLHTFCTCPRVTFNVRISYMPWSEKPATPPPGSSIRSHTMEQRPQKSRPAKSCIWSTIINDNVN